VLGDTSPQINATISSVRLILI